MYHFTISCAWFRIFKLINTLVSMKWKRGMCTLLRIKLPKKCVYVANEAADSHSMWNNIFELACQHGLISHFFNALQPNAAVFLPFHSFAVSFFVLDPDEKELQKNAHTHTESPESTTFINVWIYWNNSNCGAHNKWYKICYNLFDLCFMAFSYPKYTYCMHCITAQRCKTGPNTERPKKEHTATLWHAWNESFARQKCIL